MTSIDTPAQSGPPVTARRGGRFRESRTIAGLIGFALALCGIAAPAAAGTQSLAAHHADALDLAEAQVFVAQPALVARGPGEPAGVRMPVEIDGQRFELLLSPFSVRGADYRVLIDDGSGDLTPAEPAPSRTYRGVVDGVAGAVVAASLTEQGQLRARVLLDAGDSYWIQPLTDAVPAAEPDEYVVYHESQVLPSEAGCGVPIGQPAIDQPAAPAPGGPISGAGTRGALKIAEIAFDADYEYFLSRGSSVASVENRIDSIVNAINIQYERDIDVRHEIVAVIVRTSINDPYTATTSIGLLNQFDAVWEGTPALDSIQRDTAHLFTGRSFIPVDGFIGFARIAVICSPTNAYGWSESDWTGNFAGVTDITAHELGHNWAGQHCVCASPAYTMNPNITGANRFQPSLTIPTLEAHRDSRTCLSNLVPVLPGAFNQLTPTDGATGVDPDSAVVFTWEVSANADGYRFTLDDNPDFSSPIFDDASALGPLFQAPAFLIEPGTTYVWRVEAFNADGAILSNAGFSFTTTPATPVCPQDISGDGTVDVLDLNRLLAAFNQPAAVDPPADITGDGLIDVLDLNALLAAFNTACP